MIRVDIEGIVMSGGPLPSVLVLRERVEHPDIASSRRSLSIQTGPFEAAAIGRGMKAPEGERPITHDLMLDALTQLGAKVERVEVDRVDAPLFCATVVLGVSGTADELRLDARPSDAIALAVRANAPIYVEDDVMNRAGTISSPDDADPAAELERFDEFVQTLSPDDF